VAQVHDLNWQLEQMTKSIGEVNDYVVDSQNKKRSLTHRF